MGRKPAKRKLLKLTYATVKIPFLFVVCSLKASPCITKKNANSWKILLQ